jgi:hypothetical protein
MLALSVRPTHKRVPGAVFDPAFGSEAQARREAQTRREQILQGIKKLE